MTDFLISKGKINQGGPSRMKRQPRRTNGTPMQPGPELTLTAEDELQLAMAQLEAVKGLLLADAEARVSGSGSPLDWFDARDAAYRLVNESLRTFKRHDVIGKVIAARAIKRCERKG